MHAKYFNDHGPREILVTGISDYEILPGNLVRIYLGMHRGNAIDLENTLLIPKEILAALGAQFLSISRDGACPTTLLEVPAAMN